jgi:hypothetical protein
MYECLNGHAVEVHSRTLVRETTNPYQIIHQKRLGKSDFSVGMVHGTAGHIKA